LDRGADFVRACVVETQRKFTGKMPGNRERTFLSNPGLKPYASLLKVVVPVVAILRQTQKWIEEFLIVLFVFDPMLLQPSLSWLIIGIGGVIQWVV
jgi:hypothetical protein